MESETVYTDERMPGIQIRWAGGATFNVWAEDAGIEGGWANVDCFTRYGAGGNAIAPTTAEAEKAAEDHFGLLAVKD